MDPITFAKIMTDQGSEFKGKKYCKKVMKYFETKPDEVHVEEFETRYVETAAFLCQVQVWYIIVAYLLEHSVSQPSKC